MTMPPHELDGAIVVYFAAIDGCRHTGRCKHLVGGSLVQPASAVAICRYRETEGYYLFGCDSCWHVVTDTWHETIEKAKEQAEFEYEGVSKNWCSYQ
jgi:hypothetical protein